MRFFELRALCGQKDHNNLLPAVKITCDLCQGMTLMVTLIVLPREKCCSLCSFLTFFGRIWSICGRQTQGCKWKISLSRLVMRCEQCCLFVRGVMADSDSSRWFTFDIFSPNQFVKGMYSLNFYNLSYFCVKWYLKPWNLFKRLL